MLDPRRWSVRFWVLGSLLSSLTGSTLSCSRSLTIDNAEASVLGVSGRGLELSLDLSVHNPFTEVVALEGVVVSARLAGRPVGRGVLDQVIELAPRESTHFTLPLQLAWEDRAVLFDLGAAGGPDVPLDLDGQAVERPAAAHPEGLPFKTSRLVARRTLREAMAPLLGRILQH